MDEAVELSGQHDVGSYVENKKIFDLQTIELQWRFVTESVKREFLAQPAVRNTLTAFTNTPVSESLPGNFFSSLSSVDGRLDRLNDKFKEDLVTYLNTPPVPDEKIGGRVAHNFNLTHEESDMVARRYRYARDVKILALGAEIVNQENGVNLDENGEAVLPSGIKIVVNSEDEVEREDFINPSNWQKRRQIKDRVYEIEVDNRKYILKEKKTDRHTDIKKNGHRDGRLSSEEYQVAKRFNDVGTVDEGNIKLSWEKPIGYVLYPDGFSFVVFNYEENLQDYSAVGVELENAIFSHRDQFEKEYQTICDNFNNLYVSPEIISDRWTRVGSAGFDKFLHSKLKRPPKPTYDDFAKVKAYRMRRHAKNILSEMVARMGYDNSDLDGYAYRVRSQDQVKLEIVGFDFEYYSKMSKEKASELHSNLRKYYHVQDRKVINEFYWNDHSEVTRSQKAIYYGILENEES